MSKKQKDQEPILIPIDKKKLDEERRDKEELSRIEEAIRDYHRLDARVRWDYFKSLLREGFSTDQAMEFVKDMDIGDPD